MNERIAVCPGSFDPVTYGHLDIITRAAKMFDKLIVVVASNGAKHCSFTPEERVNMIKKCIPDLQNVEVEHYDGLLADYAASKNANAIIKGLRAMSDFEYEFQMALANKKLNTELDTVFLMTDQKYLFLSSTIVRDIARHGGDISELVSEEVREDILKKLDRTHQ